MDLWGYEDEYDLHEDDMGEYLPRRRPRDRQIDEAKAALLVDVFAAQPDRVFYGRQIEVMFERRFFHWITRRAFNELAAEQRVGSAVLPVRRGLVARFYWSRKVRYWRQTAKGIAKLIAEYSDERIGKAVGAHGELMFDAALPTAGFLPKGRDVREWSGVKWEDTEHDLDRVFERDGVAYGTEVKNTLDYIERAELEVKLAMCEALGLRPLFIMRYAPKSYVEMVRQAGGFSLLFEYQLYPPGLEDLGRRLRDELGLKVGWPTRVADGTVNRLLKWHKKVLGA